MALEFAPNTPRPGLDVPKLHQEQALANQLNVASGVGPQSDIEELLRDRAAIVTMEGLNNKPDLKIDVSVKQEKTVDTSTNANVTTIDGLDIHAMAEVQAHDGGIKSANIVAASGGNFEQQMKAKTTTEQNIKHAARSQESGSQISRDPSKRDAKAEEQDLTEEQQVAIGEEQDLKADIEQGIEQEDRIEQEQGIEQKEGIEERLADAADLDIDQKLDLDQDIQHGLEEGVEQGIDQAQGLASAQDLDLSVGIDQKQGTALAVGKDVTNKVYNAMQKALEDMQALEAHKQELREQFAMASEPDEELQHELAEDLNADAEEELKPAIERKKIDWDSLEIRKV